MTDAIDTLVMGAGQAGLALSRLLSDAGHEHVVVDRGQIGERWRSERWESLSLLTPNWMNVLPGSAPHADPDGYLSGRGFADYMQAYAHSFRAPVREGVNIYDVRRREHGYRVRTTAGSWDARNVVIATGHSDLPELPAVAAATPPSLLSLHASRYRTPDALPDGGVLVVGAGPSGQQLAAELARHGREVVLAVGGHRRLPRRYRGRDIFSWMVLNGSLDETLRDVPDPLAARRAHSLPLSGARGGERLDLGLLSELGVVVAGRLTGINGGRAHFAEDLPASVNKAEQWMRRQLARIDTFAARTGLDDKPAEPIDRIWLPPAPESIDLRGFGTVIWATGYRRSYPWLRVPVRDKAGELVQKRGATPSPGLFTLGLRFQWRRKSHYIGGVGADAADLAALIAA